MKTAEVNGKNRIKPADEKAGKIEIHGLDVRQMSVRIVGTTPLLSNKPNLRAIEDQQLGLSTPGREAKDVDDLFAKSLYLKAAKNRLAVLQEASVVVGYIDISLLKLEKMAKQAPDWNMQKARRA